MAGGRIPEGPAAATREPRMYVGLAATLHDPALAIVDDAGRPVFAEATERHLQSKRAYNCPPDDMVRVPRLLATYCDPDATVICARSWSSRHLTALEMMSNPAPSAMTPATDSRDDQNWPYPDARRSRSVTATA